MARSFRQIAPDRLQMREGGGLLALFGLPFLAAGIGIGFAGLGVVPMPSGGDLSAAAWPLLSLVFTGVGSVFVFGRAWTTVDATRRFVTKEWGLLWPIYSRQQALDGCTAVMIGFESGDSDSADQFPIFLKSTGAPSVRLCSFTQYAASRESAAAIARQLGLDLEDATTDHAERMPASQAELSLQQRERAGRKRDQPAAAPPFMESTVSYDSDAIRIVTPLPRVHPLLIGATLVPSAIALAIVAPLGRFLRQPHTQDPFGRIFLGMLMLGFGVLPAASAVSAWLRSRVGRTIVAVSGEGVLLQKRGVWGVNSQTKIASADIIDVDYSTRESMMASARRSTEQRILDAGLSRSGPPEIGARTEWLIGALSRLAKSRGIILKTRQGLTTFGEGLADDEIQYLCAVVRQALVR